MIHIGAPETSTAEFSDLILPKNDFGLTTVPGPFRVEVYRADLKRKSYQARIIGSERFKDIDCRDMAEARIMAAGRFKKKLTDWA